MRAWSAGAAPQECDNGLCYIALAMTGQKTRVKKLNAEGDDRREHKDYFAKEAFNLLLEHL
jgi:nicotinamide mononucleotide (NMN) deamidase PncC